MLDLFPEMKNAKEINASLNLLVSAFVSLAEEILEQGKEEEVLAELDRIRTQEREENQSVSKAMATEKHTQRGGKRRRRALSLSVENPD